MRKVLWFALLVALASGCGRKPAGEDHFAAGLTYYKDGRFDKAAVEFGDALASMQTNALALNFLGVSRLKTGETDIGLRNLQDAIRLDPNYIPARYNLALAQLDQGQADSAVANLRQVVQSSAAPADSQYQLGLAYMHLSAWAQAEEVFKRHLQSNPTSVDTLNCLGIVTAHKNDFAQAKHWFEQCIAADPKFPTAYLNLASLENRHLGQKKEALAHYQTYVDLTPKHQPREDVRLAMLQINQELTVAAKPPAHAAEPPPKPPPVEVAQIPKQAAPQPEAPAPKPVPPPATVVTASVASASMPPPPPTPPPAPIKKVRTPVSVRTLKPGNRAKALVILNNAYSLQHQNKLADAISEYTKAMATDPSYPLVYYDLATAYTGIGQMEHALDNYELALMADANYADARFNYAVVLQEQGYTEDAIAQFEKVIAKNPTDALAHLSLGHLYARDRATYTKARDHYQTFLKLSPDSPLARGVHRWLDESH